MPSDGGVGLTRAARQRQVARELARAALLVVDLARPDTAPAVVAALGTRRGARPEVAAEATRLLGRALAGPLVARARRAHWLARDVPVAVEVDGLVVEDRLAMVFEEPAGLVIVRATPATESGVPGPASEQLAPAFGRAVHEVLTLDVALLSDGAQTADGVVAPEPGR
jgi:hypothetical protein